MPPWPRIWGRATTIAEAFFRALDPQVEVERLVEDGDAVPAGADLMRITGRARALLTAERSALNTLQHLSGIATLTRRYVDAIAGPTVIDPTSLPKPNRLYEDALRSGDAVAALRGKRAGWTSTLHTLAPKKASNASVGWCYVFEQPGKRTFAFVGVCAEATPAVARTRASAVASFLTNMFSCRLSCQ